MRRAKLVCTIGPASDHPETVRALVDAGMDVARINFSHGADDQHRASFQRVREAAASAGRTVAALADLSGPKVRLGPLEEGEIFLQPGDRFALRSEDGTGDRTGASTSHPGLAGDVQPGDRILLADGAAEVVVVEVSGDVVTEVVKASSGGRVGSGAGVNVPAERLSLPAVTDKDRRDLDTALDLGFDLVAQSFVRSAADVRDLRRLMAERRVPIVAKVENRAAVEDAPAIIATADLVMVARGDLGAEIPLEEIPVVQKELVRACLRAGTPSIVATQMFESMLASSRPTRAEVSDAANAVLDGADGVLLSGETAIGRFPVEAAETAVRVIEVAEDRGTALFRPLPEPEPADAGRAVARAACRIQSTAVDVAAISCFTRSGRTARLIAAERPRAPIVAFSADPTVARSLAASWGITSLVSDRPSDVDDLIEMMDRRLVSEGLADTGRTVVMVAAAPVGRAPTNLLKVHRLGSPGIA